MPRDKFISDNLINIRDHLRQNCAIMAQQNAPSSENTADPGEIHLDLKNPVPMGGGSARSAEREYNEFTGRLQHDLAAIGAELSNIEIKQKEFSNFNARLLETIKSLQELPVQNSQDFFREFDRLRIMYFQYAGRVSAYRNNEKSLPQQTAEVTPQQPKAKHDILLALSILISALLISLTLLIVF